MRTAVPQLRRCIRVHTPSFLSPLELHFKAPKDAAPAGFPFQGGAREGISFSGKS